MIKRLFTEYLQSRQVNNFSDRFKGKTMEGKILLIAIGFAIALFFGFIFTPVSSNGDSPAYINYALQICGESIPENHAHRSPLYSIILAGFIKVFGTDNFSRIVILFQFILNLITTILLYRILNRTFRNPKYVLIGSVFFFFNMATVYYGYHLLTESVTVSLFILSVSFLFDYLDKLKKIFLFLSGFFVSLLVLARYSTLPLIAGFILIVIVIDLFKTKIKIRSVFLKISIFLLVPCILFNTVSYSNLLHYGFYKLFPTGGSNLISRNAILVTINGNEKVSPENKPILDIFLKSKANILKDKEMTMKKGSLRNFDKLKITDKLSSGYKIYKSAFTDLSEYYKIDPLNSEFVLSSKLSSFYKEIIKQNHYKIFLMRFYSFLNSFRSSSGITSSMDATNLDILPGWLIVSYKVSFILISVFTFICSFCYSIFTVFKKIRINLPVLILIVLCYSFYFINFVFGTMDNANRFKFSSDTIMFGLFIFYFGSSILYFKKQSAKIPSAITPKKGN